MGLRNTALKSLSDLALVHSVVGLTYFVLAKAGLSLAMTHPIASAFWPATGFALAAVMIWGSRLAPTIFIAALLANAGIAGVVPSISIAIGNTLEALCGAYLLNRWSTGRTTFATAWGILIFAISVTLATTVSATIGTATLSLSAATADTPMISLWLTWWLGDLAGALVVTPLVILWLPDPPTREDLAALAPLIGAAAIAGLIAFFPSVVPAAHSGSLAFITLGPLMWAALRFGQRATSLTSLLLAVLAVTGALVTTADLPVAAVNSAFQTTLIFIIGTSLPSLALSAETALNRKAQDRLGLAHGELETEVEARTADLLREIEQRKELELANEQQRIQLIDAQRLAKLGSWSWEVATGEVTWSPQLYEIYGLRPGEFSGSVEDFLSRVHPEDRDSVAATVRKAYETGTGFRSHERILRPDGEVRHLESYGEVIKDADGKVTRMLGICQDTTAQKVADDALRESEEQIRRLVNGIHDYAIFMLDPGGHVVSWNAGAARIKQYTRDEILGKHVSTFYTPEDRATDLPGRALRTASREGRYEGEGWRVRHDGTRFWANVVIDAIYDAAGKLVGFGKITRDVTEKREAMLALEHTRDQLAQAQKMETIGQVTGGVAHDFNNLLAAIISSLHLLEKRLPGEPQSRRLVENALNAAERGASLTQRLLTFARRQDLKPEIVDVSRLVSGMTDLLSRSIGPSVTITARSDGSRVAATVDPTQLELAIFNLALNARDAMPEGGTLSISMRKETIAPELATADLKAGHYVAISVHDTGIGMDDATLKRSIEPFFTTKGIGKGTGLGLSMVQGLAAQSGGAMKIESASGKGTTVTVWLPASEQAITIPPSKPSYETDAVKGCHILVVDDDPLVSMGTVAMLEDLGHSAIEVSSGRQALTVLGTEPNIDVVITDQAMPGMTGVELIRKIREQRPTLPIILATGWADLPDNPVPELLRLSKPYRQEDLAIALSRVLGVADQRD